MSSQAPFSKPTNPLQQSSPIGSSVFKEDPSLQYPNVNMSYEGIRDGSLAPSLSLMDSGEGPTTSPLQSSRVAAKNNRLKKVGGSPVSLNRTSSASGVARDTLGPIHNEEASPSGSPRLINLTLPSRPDGPTTIQATSRSRPVPFRTQSYSKRHASFDTPREVPMPSPSPAVGLVNSIPTFEDSDWEDHSLGHFYPSGTPRVNNGILSDSSTPLGKAVTLGVQGVRHEPKDERHTPLMQPHLTRNNSAPTPPAHSPGTQQVDVLSLSNASPVYSTNRTENSSADSGSGSEYQSPIPASVTTASSEERSRRGQPHWEDNNSGSQTWAHRPDATCILNEDRLSTLSLPLPQSHGIERVSRLPPPSKPHVEKGFLQQSANGIDGPSRTGDLTSVVEVASSMDSRNVSPARQGSTYRSSFPVTADYGREIPLPGQPRLSDPTSISSLDRRNHEKDEGDKNVENNLLELPRIAAPNSPQFGDKAPMLCNAEQVSTPSTMSYGRSINDDQSMACHGHHAPGQGEREARYSSNAISATGAHTQETIKHVDTTPLMTVETTSSAYILEVSLPGYERDEITLSTRKKRVLHIVADGFVSGGGHFERRVSFGYDADMARIRAEFNGSMLKITVPRRPISQVSSLGTLSPANSTLLGGIDMSWRGRATAF